MNKSIKLSLIALLWMTTESIFGMHERDENTINSSQRSQRTTLTEEQQARLEERSHRQQFFHSDNITNLEKVQITAHDNKSISSLRRWWDSIGEKGNLTLVSDAFNKGENFNDFTSEEKTAFGKLDADDQITLVREYLDKLKQNRNNAINAEKVSLKNTLERIGKKTKQITEELQSLQDEKEALDRAWNRLTFKHMFKNDEEKKSRKQQIDSEIAIREAKRTAEANQANQAIKTSEQQQKAIVDKFDEQVEKFIGIINQSLASKNMQLRFNLKTETFQVHKINTQLELRQDRVIPITPDVRRANEEQAARERQADLVREQAEGAETDEEKKLN